ncbi:MAG TPA: hypothetical protein VFP34_11005 [Microlunatus sp.]|nr:hypothetical protein [Microlunatus sp.]
MVDLETAVDQVYAAAPEDFMAVRTALVAEARQARDRELAKAIGALRKPTRSAWLVNLLARESTAEMAALLDLGAALREAQAQLSGPELRRLSGQRQAVVRELVRRAGELSAVHGHRATDAQLQEVGQHLQAALGDPALADDVRRGRVAQIVTVGGFGMWEAGPPAPPMSAGVTAERADDAPTSHDQAAADGEPDKPSGPTEAEVEEAHSAWRSALTAVEEAQRSAAVAATVAQQAADAVEELRERLANAERTAAAAEENRRSAERRLEDVRTVAEDAEAHWERLSR